MAAQEVTTLDKHKFNHPVQHRCSLNLGFKERYYRPHFVSKDIPDFFHMPFLHLNTVSHEFCGISAHLVLLDDAVDQHAPNRYPEFIKPIDETGDHRDRKGLGQGGKKESGQIIVGKEALGLSHPFFKA